ncbi:hypothetical protein BO99DRAFT_471234, partial [Aspergillus violaceofuscus CBS 115571]
MGKKKNTNNKKKNNNNNKNRLPINDNPISNEQAPLVEPAPETVAEVIENGATTDPTLERHYQTFDRQTMQFHYYSVAATSSDDGLTPAKDQENNKPIEGQPADSAPQEEGSDSTSTDGSSSPDSGETSGTSTPPSEPAELAADAVDNTDAAPKEDSETPSPAPDAPATDADDSTPGGEDATPAEDAPKDVEPEPAAPDAADSSPAPAEETTEPPPSTEEDFPACDPSAEEDQVEAEKQAVEATTAEEETPAVGTEHLIDMNIDIVDFDATTDPCIDGPSTEEVPSDTNADSPSGDNAGVNDTSDATNDTAATEAEPEE